MSPPDAKAAVIENPLAMTAAAATATFRNFVMGEGSFKSCLGIGGLPNSQVAARSRGVDAAGANGVTAFIGLYNLLRA